MSSVKLNEHRKLFVLSFFVRSHRTYVKSVICGSSEVGRGKARPSLVFGSSSVLTDEPFEMQSHFPPTMNFLSLNPRKLTRCITSSFPIVAACVLRWIEFRIFDPSYFKLDQGTTPVHLIIIDEVCIPAAVIFCH